MKQILTSLAALALAGLSGPAAASAPFEGRWANPQKSVIIEVAPCGSAYCGTVVWATERAKANARKGGTDNLVGTRLISGVKAAGDGTYKGRGFVPKQNIHAPATVRIAGGNTLIVKGCALGFICKEQRWTRVN